MGDLQPSSSATFPDQSFIFVKKTACRSTVRPPVKKSSPTIEHIKSLDQSNSLLRLRPYWSAVKSYSYLDSIAFLGTARRSKRAWDGVAACWATPQASRATPLHASPWKCLGNEIGEPEAYRGQLSFFSFSLFLFQGTLKEGRQTRWISRVAGWICNTIRSWLRHYTVFTSN